MPLEMNGMGLIFFFFIVLQTHFHLEVISLYNPVGVFFGCMCQGHYDFDLLSAFLLQMRPLSLIPNARSLRGHQLNHFATLVVVNTLCSSRP